MPTADLNTALVSYILTGLGGFSTAAGYVGPNGRVDHDLSLMIPELWCRLRPEQREANFLIQNGYLEKLHDFEHGGRKNSASRVGDRLTHTFLCAHFCGLFSHTHPRL